MGWVEGRGLPWLRNTANSGVSGETYIYVEKAGRFSPSIYSTQSAHSSPGPSPQVLG